MVEFAAMGWLKDHSYIATWLSPCIAIIIAIIKSHGKAANIDLKELAIYIAFFTALAALITPTLGDAVRSTMGTVFFVTLGYIMVSLKR